MQARTLNPSPVAEWLLIASALSASAVILYPGWLLLFVSGTICLLGGIFRWNWLFYLLFFFLPVGPLLKSDLPFEDLSSVLRIIAAVGVFLGYLLRQEPLPSRVFRSKLSILTLAYLMTVSISAAKNGISIEAHRCLFHLCSYVIFYFGVLAWLQQPEQLRTIIHTLVISSVLVSLFAFYQFAIGGYGGFYFQIYPDQLSPNDWDGRVPSVLNYSNSLGGFMAIMGALSLATGALDSSPEWRGIGKVAFGFSAMTVLLSQSRGALAGFLVVVVLGVASVVRGWKLRIAVLIGTLILAWTLVPLLPDFSQHLTVKAEDSSVASRLIVFASAAQLFLQSPIVGVGYGNFRHLMDFDVFDLRANNWDAHNMYLQVLAETGILGFVAFGSLLLLALVYARRIFRRGGDLSRLLGFATLAALCSALVHGMVDSLFNVSPQFGTLFWIVLAMVAAYEKILSQPESKMWLQRPAEA